MDDTEAKPMTREEYEKRVAEDRKWLAENGFKPCEENDCEWWVPGGIFGCIHTPSPEYEEDDPFFMPFMFYKATLDYGSGFDQHTKGCCGETPQEAMRMALEYFDACAKEAGFIALRQEIFGCILKDDESKENGK